MVEQTLISKPCLTYELGEPDTSMLKSYNNYVKYSLINNLSLNKKELAAIQLASTLRPTAASLETYDRIMEWHFRITGELQDPYKLSDVSGYVSREALFKKLQKRYQMTEYSNQLITKLKLPYAKSIATIVHYNAKDVILSLLTDPRIRDEDYLFFGNDPFGSPPDKLNFVEDLGSDVFYSVCGGLHLTLWNWLVSIHCHRVVGTAVK